MKFYELMRIKPVKKYDISSMYPDVSRIMFINISNSIYGKKGVK
jgi:hypothetical protein